MEPRKRRNCTTKLLIFLVPAVWLFVVIYVLAVTSREYEDDIVHFKQRIHGAPSLPKQYAMEFVHSSEQKPMELQYKGFNINLKRLKRGLGVLRPPSDPRGPGEMGKPVELTNVTKEQEKLIEEGWEEYAFNRYVSDMISIHRSLPDVRDKECRDIKYPTDKLPATSVIICFHNEAWSTLLRTFHSVLERSPPHLIKEVILVDDFSDFPHLNETLERYVAHFPKIKLVRAQKREGLIRARLLGHAAASSPVLTFLDSHCECAEGWLEPLLYEIYLNMTNVVYPIIDVIADDTFEYRYEDGGLNVGGFDWDMQFTWIDIPKRVQDIRPHTYLPVDSPTMAGGLFSIDKSFFERLGTYDDGFDIWGAENLELSFKTWMCGGTLQMVPCSHVGHIFRTSSPYKWREGVNVLKKNAVRLAKVWLDEYAKYYYQRVGNDLGDYGDVTSRRELRERLQCKSFKWYLDNVYPEVFLPSDMVAAGEVENLGEGSLCLDKNAEISGRQKAVGLYPCHGQGGNQFWMLSPSGEIRRDDSCLDYTGTDIGLYPCHGAKGNQLWVYTPENHRIEHSTGSCLAMHTDHIQVTMEKCSDEPRQQWKFENYDPSKAVREREF